MRQAKKRALRNAIVKNAYKDAVKAIRKAMTAGEVSRSTSCAPLSKNSTKPPNAV